MNEHGITKENLLRSLPVPLSGDPKMLALAEAVAGVLAQRREEIQRIAVYPNIDQLDEGLLDILARDFKVDWWDDDYSLEEKRRTLASSWQVHKTLGTKYAVETALRAVYPGTKVVEWFDYSGDPYHFQLDIDVTDESMDPDKQRRVLDRLEYYKNLRSHLDGVKYSMAAAGTAACAGAKAAVSSQRVSVEMRPDVQWPRVKLFRPVMAVPLIQRTIHRVALNAPEAKRP